MSVYFDSLVGKERTRYLEKLHLINNVDPYDCDTSDFSHDIISYPNIVFLDITQYLMTTMSFYTFEEFRAYKSLEGYKLFEHGWVREIICKQFGENVLILAKVLQSQKLNEASLEPWVITKSNGEILCAHCNCIAGIVEVCTHVAAVLFAIQETRASLPEESDSDDLLKSVTEVKAVRDVPKGRDKDNYAIDWTKMPGHRVVKRRARAPAFTKDQIISLLRQLKAVGIITPALLTTSPCCDEITEDDLKRYYKREQGYF